jgi:hypothetical protein
MSHDCSMSDAWRNRWGVAEAQWVVQHVIAIDLPSLATDAILGGWDVPRFTCWPG